MTSALTFSAVVAALLGSSWAVYSRTVSYEGEVVVRW